LEEVENKTMKRRWLVILFCCSLVLGLLALCVLSVFQSKDRVILEVVSPSGKLRATVLERETAFWKDYSFLVMLHESGKPVVEGEELVELVEAGVLPWVGFESDARLKVVLANGYPLKKRSEALGVAIDYK